MYNMYTISHLAKLAPEEPSDSTTHATCVSNFTVLQKQTGRNVSSHARTHAGTCPAPTQYYGIRWTS